MDWTIKITDIAMVLAAFLGPAAAVIASEWRQRHRQRTEHKMAVFRTLMSTRGTRLRREHVEAINQIEFSFPRKSSPAVEDARYLYRKHLRSPASASQDQATFEIWTQKANDLFVELLFQMAKDLRVPFSKSDIVEDSYQPDAYLLDEMASKEIKHLLLKILRNEHALNINTSISPGPSDEEIKAFMHMREVWQKFLGGETVIPVRVEKKI